MAAWDIEHLIGLSFTAIKSVENAFVLARDAFIDLHPLAVIKEWQPLIASFIAIGAVAAGWRGVTRQINAAWVRDTRKENEALQIVHEELAPLVEVLNMVWRVVDLVLESGQPDAESRTTWAKSTIPFHLPPKENLEGLASQIERRAFAHPAIQVYSCRALLKGSVQPNRYD